VSRVRACLRPGSFQPTLVGPRMLNPMLPRNDAMPTRQYERSGIRARARQRMNRRTNAWDAHSLSCSRSELLGPERAKLDPASHGSRARPTDPTTIRHARRRRCARISSRAKCVVCNPMLAPDVDLQWPERGPPQPVASGGRHRPYHGTSYATGGSRWRRISRVWARSAPI
jgi:hypothetical protein